MEVLKLKKNDPESYKYLVDIVDDEDGMRLYYANGDTVPLEKDDKNFDIANKVFEQQVQDGLDNKSKFGFKKRMADIGVGLSSLFVAGGGIYSILSLIPADTYSAIGDAAIALGNSTSLNHPLIGGVICGLGVCGIIVSAKSSSRLKKICSTLDKYDYREQHKDDLAQVTTGKISSGLVGTSQDLIDLVNDEGEGAFDAINDDCFDKSDLEKIIENVDRERSQKFVYAKKR